MARTSLAWKNLTHQPTRTVVSIGGIGFAILLMFMQLGFLGAVGDTATNVYDRLNADLLIRSSEYLHLYDARTVQESTRHAVTQIDEVAQVRLLDLTVANWRNPKNGEFRPVAVIGMDADVPAMNLPELAQHREWLRRSDHMLVDSETRKDYGPANGKAFGPADTGQATEVSGRQVRIVGTFELGTGLAANGAILINRPGFRRISPIDHSGKASLILVQIRPGADPQAAKQAVQSKLRSLGGPAAHYQVLTRQEAAWKERWRWYLETPIGVIFMMGVALAFVVGAVICYMVLAADVIAHLPEYATLKAMGYSNAYLGHTLLSQACYLASISLPPAIAAALLLYRVTEHFAGIEIRMTLTWLVLVTILSFIMCSTAGWIALQKLAKAEPASLF